MINKIIIIIIIIQLRNVFNASISIIILLLITDSYKKVSQVKVKVN
jgi:hypothetical protein